MSHEKHEARCFCPPVLSLCFGEAVNPTNTLPRAAEPSAKGLHSEPGGEGALLENKGLRKPPCFLPRDTQLGFLRQVCEMWTAEHLWVHLTAILPASGISFTCKSTHTLHTWSPHAGLLSPIPPRRRSVTGRGGFQALPRS